MLNFKNPVIYRNETVRKPMSSFLYITGFFDFEHVNFKYINFKHINFEHINFKHPAMKYMKMETSVSAQSTFSYISPRGVLYEKFNMYYLFSFSRSL